MHIRLIHIFSWIKVICLVSKSSFTYKSNKNLHKNNIAFFFCCSSNIDFLSLFVECCECISSFYLQIPYTALYIPILTKVIHRKIWLNFNKVFNYAYFYWEVGFIILFICNIKFVWFMNFLSEEFKICAAFCLMHISVSLNFMLSLFKLILYFCTDLIVQSVWFLALDLSNHLKFI